MSGPEALALERVRTPESNTLCRVRSINHAIGTAKQTRHVFAEVHRRGTENSRQCAGCGLVIIGGLEPRSDVSRYAHDADEEAKAPLSHKAQPPREGQQLMPQTSFQQTASVSLFGGERR